MNERAECEWTRENWSTSKKKTGGKGYLKIIPAVFPSTGTQRKAREKRGEINEKQNLALKLQVL